MKPQVRESSSHQGPQIASSAGARLACSLETKTLLLGTVWYLGSCCSFQQALQNISAQEKDRGRSVSRQRK